MVNRVSVKLGGHVVSAVSKGEQRSKKWGKNGGSKVASVVCMCGDENGLFVCVSACSNLRKCPWMKKPSTNKLVARQRDMGAYPAGKRTSLMSWCVHRGMSSFFNDASCSRNGRMTIIILAEDFFDKENASLRRKVGKKGKKGKKGEGKQRGGNGQLFSMNE